MGSMQTWPMISIRPPASTDSATKPSRWSWSGPQKYAATLGATTAAAPWNRACRLSGESPA